MELQPLKTSDSCRLWYHASRIRLVQYLRVLDNPIAYLDPTGLQVTMESDSGYNGHYAFDLAQVKPRQPVHSYEKSTNSNYRRMGLEPVPISSPLVPTAGSIIRKADGYYYIIRE